MTKSTARLQSIPEWALAVISSSQSGCLSFSDHLYLRVNGDRKEYSSNITDWSHRSLWTTPPKRVDSTKEPLDQVPQPISHLEWHLLLAWPDFDTRSYHQTDLMELVSWPRLTELPEEVVPTVARICAVLERRKTGAFVLPKILGLEQDCIARMVFTLHQRGNLRFIGAEAKSAVTEAYPDDYSTPESGFFRRVWKRFTAKG